MSEGIVYLVGAGPGDPGLLTRRGADLLGRADVVLYDRLVHPEVLKLAGGARLVDVGKQPGESGSGQARINDLLVGEARAGNIVVRLKGGDPFLFGRGGEEAEVCASAGIAFEIVPGVTSAIAAPAYAGIPLTHRSYGSWAAVATGHEDPRKSESGLDWDALARAPTSVFLMGIERLEHIVARLQSAGRAPDTAAAVISWATWPRQRVVRATLEKISDAAADLDPPAVLVIGDVVDLAGRLDWAVRRPLAGKRVFVTRTRAQAGRLGELLREAGAEPLEFPAISVTRLEDYAALDEALGRLDSFGWVIFASVNAVDAFWERLRGRGGDARALAGARIAAVGPATERALRSRGLHADLVPPTFTSQALTEVLGRPQKGSRGRGRRMLLPRAADAPEDLVRGLERNGWRCEAAPAYRTVVDDSSVQEGRSALDEGVDAVLFTSASTVRNFCDLWGPPPPGCVVCCIGPRTAAAAEGLGVGVDAVAAEHTVEGLVAALVAAVGR